MERENIFDPGREMRHLKRFFTIRISGKIREILLDKNSREKNVEEIPVVIQFVLDCVIGNKIYRNITWVLCCMRKILS